MQVASLARTPKDCRQLKEELPACLGHVRLRACVLFAVKTGKEKSGMNIRSVVE